MKKSAIIAVLVVFLGGIPVAAGGMFERSGAGDAAEDRRDADVPADEPVEVPEWVASIQSGSYGDLYPGPDGGGFIGVGTGSTREEATAAAAVDFAGNVSTEVDAAVIQEETATEETSSFLLQVQSEVRSQAIISGLNPEIWEHPRSGVWYALYRATAAEYRRRLEQWIDTMETMSEANRAREMQRLEDERAAAEARREQIKLEELQEQVRLADRRMRADRHREFLYHTLEARHRSLPSGYIPEEGVEVTAGYTQGFDEFLVDGSVDVSLWRIFLIGVDVEAEAPSEEWDPSVTGTGRVMVQLLSRAGWVTSTTLALGAFGTARIGGEEDESFWESGAWVAGGPFGVADILVPEWAHTRYSLYVGRDYAQLRLGWYPFWRSVSEGIEVSAAGAFDFTDREDHYAGVGLAFRPVERVRIVIETRNLDRLRGGITFTY